jgi:hypothetical protein
MFCHNIKKNSKAIRYVVCVLGIILFSIYFLLNFSDLKIVNIKENAVAYSDGSAEIVINDNFNGDYVVYSAKVDAIDDNGQYSAPDLVYRGGTWDRVVYTYSQSNYCENKIFFMDRDEKIAKILNTDYCIGKTLDEHDIKCFLATKYNKAEAVIGFYDSGETFSKINIPYAVDRPINTNLVASNWELTKLIIPVGSCDKGAKDMKIFLWDVENKIIEDKTPLNFDCDINKIIYNRSDNKFYIEMFDRKKEVVNISLEE